MQDLDKAIVLGREEICLRPQGHPERPVSLDNLAVQLSGRYGQLHPQGHPRRPMSSSGLAADFFTRYKRLGTTEGLNDVIFLRREVLALCAQGHLDWWRLLKDLAENICTRCQELGVMNGLNDTIVHGREALNLCP